MYELIEVKEITKKMVLLFDNPIAMLSKQTGLSRPTVSKFFNGKTVKPSSTELLYELCYDLIEKKESKRKKINMMKFKTATPLHKEQDQTTLFFKEE